MTQCGWREHRAEANRLRNCKEKKLLPHQVACSIFEARDGGTCTGQKLPAVATLVFPSCQRHSMS